MAFENIRTREGEVLRSSLLSEVGVRHGFGTRLGGTSEGRYESANRGFFSEDRGERVQQNWRRLLVEAGLTGCRLHYLKQVHGADVVEVAREDLMGPEDELRWRGEADGLVTRVPGVALAITTADCVPVLMNFDALEAEDQAPVAALHCGWRSVEAGILPRFLERMGRSPRAVALGPHIRSCHFEVGPDVAERLAAATPGGAVSAVLPGASGERPRVDLEAVLLAQLAAAGVAADRIDAGAPCTYCDGGRFFSFRRDGPGGGLLGHVIGIEALQSGAPGGPG